MQSNWWNESGHKQQLGRAGGKQENWEHLDVWTKHMEIFGKVIKNDVMDGQNIGRIGKS